MERYLKKKKTGITAGKSNIILRGRRRRRRKKGIKKKKKWSDDADPSSPGGFLTSCLLFFISSFLSLSLFRRLHGYFIYPGNPGRKCDPPAASIGNEEQVDLCV